MLHSSHCVSFFTMHPNNSNTKNSNLDEIIITGRVFSNNRPSELRLKTDPILNNFDSINNNNNKKLPTENQQTKNKSTNHSIIQVKPTTQQQPKFNYSASVSEPSFDDVSPASTSPSSGTSVSAGLQGSMIRNPRQSPTKNQNQPPNYRTVFLKNSKLILKIILKIILGKSIVFGSKQVIIFRRIFSAIS